MNKILLTFVAIIFSTSIYSSEITKESFVGEWCGEWDNTYKVCILIDSISPESKAKYRWQEQPFGKFKKNKKAIERVNLNTLRIENIWFVIDEKNLTQAKVVGVFKFRSRQATLSKKVAETNK